jgi:nucleoside 2-deoxyribosyltransferase
MSAVLLQPRVYLAGPISHLTYEEATGWRNDFVEELKKRGMNEVDVHDPMRKKEHLANVYGKTVIPNKALDLDPLTTEKGIISRDFNDVRKCDYLIVNLLNAKTVSIGTVCEITLASELNKIVIAVMEPTGNPHDHIFIRQLINFRVPSISDAINLFADLQ